MRNRAEVNYDTHQQVKNMQSAGFELSQAEAIVLSINASREFDISRLATREQIIGLEVNNKGIEKDIHNIDTKIDSVEEKLTSKINGVEERLTTKMDTEFKSIRAERIADKAEIAEVKSDVAELKSDVAELKFDVAEVKSDVAGLKFDVAELKSDVAGLKFDVAELKSDVAELKSDVAGLKLGIAGLHTAIEKASLSNLKWMLTILMTIAGMIFGVLEFVIHK